MKKLFTLLALSLVMMACNKEEENEQLIGWDKIVADVEQTNQSLEEVFTSLGENELWVINNLTLFFEDKNGNKVESM